jgi:hypothetical protein
MKIEKKVGDSKGRKRQNRVNVVYQYLLINKDHQHDEDDKYDYECVEERKS